MRHVHGLVVGLAVVGCQGNDIEPERSTLPVVDGTAVPEGQDLAVVGLGGCTGSLITPRVVLTAAHCIGGGGMEAYFGSQTNGAGPWISGSSVETHPQADLALFTLSAAGPIAPVPFNRRTLTDDMVGEPVRIVGFGSTGEYEGGGGLKREGTTTMHSIDDEYLFLHQIGAKTCYGDSGGPYFMTFDGVEHVTAVTKGATGICEDGLSYGTRVDAFADWIDAYIAEHDPASCAADQRCADACPTVDPDCPCAADGFCVAGCADPASDPDCAGCGAGDACRADCPTLDTDCCAGGDSCNELCGDTDPDCAPPPDDDPPGDPNDPGDDDPASLRGGCAAAAGGSGSSGASLVIGMFLLCLVALARRRRT